MKKYLLVLLSTILFSCSSTQLVLINEDLSAEVELSIQASTLMYSYVLDLMTMVGEDPETYSLFNEESVQQILGSAGAKQVNLSIEDKQSLSGNFSLDNTTEAFEGIEPDNNPLITVTDVMEGKKLSIHIDRDNFFKAAQFFPMQNEMIMQTIGPSEENPLSKEEYSELLIYAFGEYADSLVIQNLLSSSMIKFNLLLPGQVTGGTNTVQTGENQVSIQIPILDLLTLEEALDYSVIYR